MTGGDTSKSRVVICGNSLCVRGLTHSLEHALPDAARHIQIEHDLMKESHESMVGRVDVVIACASACSGPVSHDLFSELQIRYPGARLIAISPTAQASELVGALDSGALGFVICGVDGLADLRNALLRVLEGEIAFSTDVSRIIVGALRDAGHGGHDPAGRAEMQGWGITDREQHVLALLCDGLTNRQIATALRISPNTVKNHLASIYRKLGASSRGEAMSIAMRIGIS